ncbi:MAG: YggS family pyridoxal phosphate-dependent enzyme [Legionella sp.]|nr:YggS family pyridoxal phosphate-dependent enzyme [Legionella sp.]
MTLNRNLKHIQELITSSEIQFHRKPGSVLLLAASKEQSASIITQAFESGVTHFGENYFQEAQAKIKLLKHLAITWHFIGPVQSNKTKGIATDFDWVHTIDRLKIANLLNEHRTNQIKPLNVCLQINLVGEKTKSGIAVEQASELAFAVSQLPHLCLRGLMTIPPPQNNPEEQYELLMQLTRLMHTINTDRGLSMDTLSMGMTDDLIPAIKAGSTIVRIGRALFGERKGNIL